MAFIVGSAFRYSLQDQVVKWDRSFVMMGLQWPLLKVFQLVEHHDGSYLSPSSVHIEHSTA